MMKDMKKSKIAIIGLLLAAFAVLAIIANWRTHPTAPVGNIRELEMVTDLDFWRGYLVQLDDHRQLMVRGHTVCWFHGGCVRIWDGSIVEGDHLSESGYAKVLSQFQPENPLTTKDIDASLLPSAQRYVDDMMRRDKEYVGKDGKGPSEFIDNYRRRWVRKD